jgi:LPXTG-site transpeptidase (sortase) family protein
MKSLLQSLGRNLFIAGTVVLAYVLLSWTGANVFQIYQQLVFVLTPPTSYQTTSTAQRTSPEPHSVIGRLEIDRLNLSVMVLEGTEDRDLLLGAGHVSSTSLPHEAGNVAIAGHRDTFFRPLQRIRKGNIITLTTHQGSYRYVVETIQIAEPTQTEVLESGLQPTLTLITCHPFSFVGPAPERLVVRARRLSGPNGQQSDVS